jgi:FSR family fosmidomycin resistance protein-like MFS transporter
MAYFFMMGQLGLALGPALAGLLLDRAASYNNTFTSTLGPLFAGRLAEQGSVAPVLLVGIFGVPAIILMLISLPNRQKHQISKAAITPESMDKRTVFPVMAFVILIAMVTIRSLAQPGVVSFIPVLFQEKGWSPAEYGLIASSFWVGSGLAGVFFGNLADYFDRRRVIAVSMVASAPAFFFLPVVDGGLAFALAIAAGALSGASHSIIVVMAQGLLPGSKALASGLILGLIFGMGALGNFLIGWISEQIGLGTAFQLVAAAVVVASVLALALPGERRVQPRPTADTVPTRA